MGQEVSGWEYPYDDYPNADLVRLYAEEDYKDLTIICGSERIRVHKAIVCSRCDFFKAACKKSSYKESRDSVIDLSADGEDAVGSHPSVVRLMIEYLYTSNYDVPLSKRQCHRETAQANTYDRSGLFSAKADLMDHSKKINLLPFTPKSSRSQTNMA